MADQCPNCGKPIRRAAKFCGFCGQILGETGLEAQQAMPGSTPGPQPLQQAPLGSSSAGETCPFCGKRNRPGVRFCANCGKQLAAAEPEPKPDPTPVVTSKPPKRRRPRIVTAGFLVTVLIIVCASLAGIAYGFGLVDSLIKMVFPEPTPTDTVAIAAELETPIPATVTFTPSATFEPTGTEIPTATLEDTETQMPTLTTTPTPKVVFEDDFKNDLLQWETWETLGESSTTASWPAEIILGEYLEIKGLGYDQVGVTSVQTVTLSQGLVIDFIAVVDTTSTASLYFDWHPGMEIRPPESIGPFYLVIDNATVRFRYNRDGDECDALLPESTMNHFRIEFGPEWEVTINVGNGEIKELCSVVIDEPEALEGHISFSGFGLVDSIRIVVP